MALRAGLSSSPAEAAQAGAIPARSPTTARVGPLPSWRLKRLQTLIEDRIDEALSLPELAAAAGVSRMHFAAQFRAATGMRPHDYLLGRRVFRAMVKMIESDEPLALVALSVGFQSQSHFTTVFKRTVGATPGAWRAAMRATLDAGRADVGCGHVQR